MADGEDMLTETVDYELAGEPYALVDRFPPLRLSLRASNMTCMVQPCKRLEVLTSTPGGQQSRPLPQYLDERTIFVTAEDERGVLAQVARALEATFKPDVVLRRMEEQRRNKLRQDISETPDVLDKLLLAVGVEDLKAAVPSAALEGLKHDTDRELEDREVAQLALAVDGLRHPAESRGEPQAQGLEPAVDLGRQAQVRASGFDSSVSRSSSPDSRVCVARRRWRSKDHPSWAISHEYQRRIADRVKELLQPTNEMRRGLLSLPTGAGKTRVAVEALVEYMSHSASDLRILWLAETDELCEQATQTWSQVWRAKGKAGTPMTLSRLWASNEPNERDGHQVVVASLAKLDTVVKRNDGDWEETYRVARQPDHHRGRRSTPIHRPAVHADPQRHGRHEAGGRDDDPSPRAHGDAVPRVQRHGDGAAREPLSPQPSGPGVFPGDDVYGYLQEHGVLARIKHRELKGADLELTADELLHATQMRRLPESVENRLGKDDQRNNEIVRSVLELPEDETALLFATSVENAKVLAALLTYNGVEARAVAGTTDPHARRRYVDDFKAKRVRVLTNYNVFTEGFDVPKVDAVFITRPTFSPNVYQQMIGRGLRGPAQRRKGRGPHRQRRGQPDELRRGVRLPSLRAPVGSRARTMTAGRHTRRGAGTRRIGPSDARLIVIAGPGAGKSEVVGERCRRLIEHDVYPEEILVISFSNVAVDVVRARTKDVVDEGRGVDCATIDSLAARVRGELEETEPRFTGFDDSIKRATRLLEDADAPVFPDVRHVIVDEVQDVVGVRARSSSWPSSTGRSRTVSASPSSGTRCRASMTSSSRSTTTCRPRRSSKRCGSASRPRPSCSG